MDSGLILRSKAVQRVPQKGSSYARSQDLPKGHTALVLAQVVCAKLTEQSSPETFLKRVFKEFFLFKGLFPNFYEGSGGSYRKECNLFFIVGRNGEFGESLYSKEFWDWKSSVS